MRLKGLRVELVETAGDPTIRDRILEHYVIGLDHPIAVQVLRRLRTEVAKGRAIPKPKRRMAKAVA